jgi:hypothetical protein
VFAVVGNFDGELRGSRRVVDKSRGRGIGFGKFLIKKVSSESLERLNDPVGNLEQCFCHGNLVNKLIQFGSFDDFPKFHARDNGRQYANSFNVIERAAHLIDEFMEMEDLAKE